MLQAAESSLKDKEASDRIKAAQIMGLAAQGYQVANTVNNASNHQDNAVLFRAEDGLGHKKYDVDPYIDFGNGKGDKTNLNDRQHVPMSKKLGITIHMGPSKMIFGKLQSKTTQPKAMGVNRIIDNAERKFQEAEKFCETNKEKCK